MSMRTITRAIRSIDHRLQHLYLDITTVKKFPNVDHVKFTTLYLYTDDNKSMDSTLSNDNFKNVSCKYLGLRGKIAEPNVLVYFLPTCSYLLLEKSGFDHDVDLSFFLVLLERLYEHLHFVDCFRTCCKECLLLLKLEEHLIVAKSMPQNLGFRPFPLSLLKITVLRKTSPHGCVAKHEARMAKEFLEQQLRLRESKV